MRVNWRDPSHCTTRHNQTVKLLNSALRHFASINERHRSTVWCKAYERHHSTVWCKAYFAYFDIFSLLGVTHKCDRQREGQIFS